MTFPADALDRARRNWDKRGWASASLGMVTASSLLRLGALIDARATTILKPHGISYSRFELLSLLMFSPSGAMPMTLLGEQLGVPAASATHMVSALEKQDLVTRTRDDQDRRSVLVSITDQGIALVSSASQALGEFFASLPADEKTLAQLTDIGRRLGER